MSTIFKAIKWGLILWGLTHTDVLLAQYTNPVSCPYMIYNDGSNTYIKWVNISNGPTEHEIHVTWQGKSYEFEDHNFPSGIYKDDDGKAYRDGLDGIGSETITFENGLNCNYFGGGVLPVELVSFTASFKGNQVQLDWTTASEENNDFFTLERSADGINFETIATIQGSGTTTEMNTYSFMDENPASGNNYYRLMQTDYNGETSYSHITQVYVSSAVISLEQIYPNPATDMIYLAVNSRNYEPVTVTVVNMYGKVVYQYTQNVSMGINELSVDVSTLSPGVYFLKVANELEELSTRFIKH